MKIYIKILNEEKKKKENKNKTKKELTTEKKENRKQYAKDYYEHYGKFGLTKGRQHKIQEEPVKIKIKKKEEQKNNVKKNIDKIEDEKNKEEDINFNWNYIKNIKNKEDFYKILLTTATKKTEGILNSFSNLQYIDIKKQIENNVTTEQNIYLQNSLFKTLNYCAKNFSSFWKKLSREECIEIQKYTFKFDSSKEKLNINKIINNKKPIYEKDIVINRKLYGENFNLDRLEKFLKNEKYNDIDDTITSWSVLPVNCFQLHSYDNQPNNIQYITYPLEILNDKRNFLPGDFFGGFKYNEENLPYLQEEQRQSIIKSKEDIKEFNSFEDFKKDIEENGWAQCVFSLQTTIKKGTAHGIYIDSNSRFPLEGEYLFQNYKKKNIKFRRDCICADHQDLRFQYTIIFDIDDIE